MIKLGYNIFRTQKRQSLEGRGKNVLNYSGYMSIESNLRKNNLKNGKT